MLIAIVLNVWLSWHTICLWKCPVVEVVTIWQGLLQYSHENEWERIIETLFSNFFVLSQLHLESHPLFAKVFSQLESHWLFTKISKCKFGCKAIGSLGQVVSSNRVVVDHDKIWVIRDCPLPGILKALRGFLGLSGYYHWFVPWYASLAVPLTEL